MMSSQRIYTYDVVCDNCGDSQQINCSSDHFRLKYVVGYQLSGWTEEERCDGSIRGVQKISYRHYCRECSI
jgi:hypothetical protein